MLNITYYRHLIVIGDHSYLARRRILSNYKSMWPMLQEYVITLRYLTLTLTLPWNLSSENVSWCWPSYLWSHDLDPTIRPLSSENVSTVILEMTLTLTLPWDLWARRTCHDIDLTTCHDLDLTLRSLSSENVSWPWPYLEISDLGERVMTLTLAWDIWARRTCHDLDLTFRSLSSENVSTMIPKMMFRPIVVTKMKKERW